MRPVLVLAIAGLSMTLAGCVETRRGYVEYTPAINEGPVGGGVYLAVATPPRRATATGSWPRAAATGIAAEGATTIAR